jgi:hypothetical protein
LVIPFIRKFAAKENHTVVEVGIMKTILGITVYSVAWFALLAGMLFLGLQSQSLADVFTLGGTFGHIESGYESFFTFAVPLLFVLILGGTAIGMIATFKEAE